MQFKFNSCYFFFFICFLFETNGILYPSGSMLSRMVQMLLVIVSAYYAIYTNMEYQVPFFIKGLNALVILYTVYGFILILSGEKLFINYGTVYNEVGRFDYIKYMYSAFLPIYPFFVFSKKGILNENTFKTFVYILFITAIVGYFNYISDVRMEFDIEEVTNNKSYIFLGLIPSLVIFINKPRKLLFFLLISVYFVLMGMKRGAILGCAICLLWFFYSIFTTTAKGKRWQVVILAIIVVAVAALFIGNLMSNSILFNSRLEQTMSGHSSQRDEIYAWFYQHFINETDIFRLFFGNGAYGTIKLYGIAAHNDWLEMAINHGVLGICVYLFYWFGLIKNWLNSKNSLAYMALGMIFVIYFSKTFFSMSGMTLGSSLALGYFLANNSGREKINIKK